MPSSFKNSFQNFRASSRIKSPKATTWARVICIKHCSKSGTFELHAVYYNSAVFKLWKRYAMMVSAIDIHTVIKCHKTRLKFGCRKSGKSLTLWCCMTSEKLTFTFTENLLETHLTDNDLTKIWNQYKLLTLPTLDYTLHTTPGKLTKLTLKQKLNSLKQNKKIAKNHLLLNQLNQETENQKSGQIYQNGPW